MNSEFNPKQIQRYVGDLGNQPKHLWVLASDYDRLLALYEREIGWLKAELAKANKEEDRLLATADAIAEKDRG